MAKIGDLQVGTSNIVDGAVNTFFTPTVDANNTYSIAVNNPFSGPNIIYCRVLGGGSMSLMRANGDYVGSIFGNGSRSSIIDLDHGPNEVYTASNIVAANRGSILGAVARKK